MTKTKSTKRALLTSALALLMCVSMLIGSTFAWFTDSVTSGINKIQSGNLDVKLEHSYGYYDGPLEEVNSETELFKYNADGKTILWEPGVSMVEYFTVTNNGNLALKFKFNLVADNATETADGKTLLDVLRVQAMQSATNAEHLSGLNSTLLPDPTVRTPYELNDFGYETYLLPGENVVFAVHVMWEPTDHDNDYNIPGGLQLDLGVMLVATQYTYESDSFDEQYDKDAMYAVGEGLYIDEEDGSYVALNTKGLSSAAALASKDSTITSVTYVTNEGEVEVPVVSSSASLDGAVANNNEIVVLTSGDYTVDKAKNTEVTIVGNGENTKISIESEGEHNTDYGFDGSTVTFENLVFNVDGYLNGYARMNATYNNCIINGTYTLNGSGVFNNCTFNKTGDDYCIWTWGAPTAEFNNCTFNTDGKAILMYGGANTVLTLNKCVFNDSGVIPGKAAIEVGSDWTTDTKKIVMTGCTVNGFDITEQKSLTWGGTNLGTNVWGNKNLLPETRLTVTIDGQSVYGN